ncbi:hypothetical protein BGZ73_006420 [Actinomortierella ambigua]|nr:hypothetical protein BGZ73_006420 [Actinomortierella ambigua]
MPDGNVQPLTVQDHLEPALPVQATDLAAPNSTSVSTTQPHQTPDTATVAALHSSDKNHVTADVSSPSKSETVQKLSNEGDDQLVQVLELLREYAQHDAALPMGAAIGIFALLLKLFSWSQWLIAVIGVLAGVFGSAYFMFASPESHRSPAIAGFGQGLFQPHGTTPLPKDDDAEEQLLSTTASNPAAAKSPDSVGAKGTTAIVRYDCVQIANDIDPMVEQMITYFLRDFVNVPVGLESEGEHTLPLRASLATMFMNLSRKLTGMRLPETPLLGVFGLQNNFIVHLRAYRELRDSRMPIEEYVAKHANRDSVLGRCYSKDERLKQYRSIAKAVCQSLLAKDDQRSVALFAVLREIMATHVIGATLDHMCDPDYVNQMIVDYFSEKPAEQAATANKGDVATQGPENDAAITALADSILTNAASLMGKGQLEPMPDSVEPASSSNGSDSGMQDDRELDQRTATPSPKPIHVVPDYAPGIRKDVADTTVAAAVPRPITLRDILINRHQHTEVYQGFMQYLQVWDAVDLVEFYGMLDFYHRQIQEGVLTGEAELEQEAMGIYNMFCNSTDSDRQVPGLKQAHGGTLYKNLSKMVHREPATCFHEVQVWVYQTLERQYWQPWRMTNAANGVDKTKDITHSAQTGESTQSPVEPTNEQNGSVSRGSSLDSRQQSVVMPQEAPVQSMSTIPRTVNSSGTSPTTPPSRSPSTDGLSATFPNTASSLCPAPSSSPPPEVLLSQTSIQKTASIASIQLIDLTHQRPKMLLSSQDLMYMVEIQAENGHGYMVSRTYQQLEQLHTSLSAHYPQVVQQATFPRWRLQTSDKLCLGLQTYLQSLLAMQEICDAPRFAWFLSKEYDQSPDGTFPDDLVQDSLGDHQGDGSPNSSSPSGSGVFSTANLAGASNVAAKNAKMAFKQASDASMAVGSFFKNLGGQIGSVIVTDEDRTPAFFRSSTESQHRSMSMQSNGSGANHAQGASSAGGSLRGPPSIRSLARSPSSESVQSIQSMRSFMSHGSTLVDHGSTRPPPVSEAAISNGSLWNPFSSNPRRSMTAEESGDHTRRAVSPDASSLHSLSNNGWSDVDAERRRRGTLDGQELRPAGFMNGTDLTQAKDPRQQAILPRSHDDHSDRASILTVGSNSDLLNDKLYVPSATAEEKTRMSTASSVHSGTTPPPARVSTPGPLPNKAGSAPPPTSSPMAPRPKTERPTLLSSDELDLLIETTFTVLEDMLDFSRGQALRRMTFGVLRELVRKSYRTAINQSFSEWALHNTSHEYAVEMVRWMKDDFFWPNGQWPAPASDHPGQDSSQQDDTQGTSRGGEGEGEGEGNEEKKERTEAEKLATKEEARQLMRRALPASMVAVLGKDACVRAMTDVFEMFQIRELNLGLAMSVLEIVVRLVLTK